MTVEVTPTGISTIGYRFFIIWTVTNLVLILPAVYFFFPETKGLSLEAIDEIFIRSKNIFEPVWVAKKIHKGAYGDEEPEDGKEKLPEIAMEKENETNGTNGTA